MCVRSSSTAFRAPPDRWQALALGLVLGGALGNLTDRLVRGPRAPGRVVDFIDVHIWPVFNVADTAIVVGRDPARLVEPCATGRRRGPTRRGDRDA